ncbi:type II toxin-antitoxin system HicA family toxin [Acidithiobacillus ferrooxidans]|uniref:type II toxin-antitoxin system HicA family toxin n=1 Tax=Acidithiobacillus ferrooxidans TaxID=920 RepID=UPI001D04D7F9|nr:type II toxin-antitoxin system HicA family toxin [Acidithiobacillus ferrooxidans]
MPKLPHVSGATAVRALERLGFTKIRQSGSHVIMRRGSKGCVVPMHSGFSTLTLMAKPQPGSPHGRCAIKLRSAGDFYVCAGHGALLHR